MAGQGGDMLIGLRGTGEQIAQVGGEVHPAGAAIALRPLLGGAVFALDDGGMYVYILAVDVRPAQAADLARAGRDRWPA